MLTTAGQHAPADSGDSGPANEGFSPPAPVQARWPERLRRQLKSPHAPLVLVAWLVIVLSGLQLLLFSFGRDQSIYAVIAEGLLQGKVPYRDLWDFKPPGIYFVYALAQGAFGKHMWAPRLIECAGLLVMVGAFIGFARRYFGSWQAGLVGGALAALLHAQLEFWHSGQPESFGGQLTALALLLTALDASDARRRWLQWSGVGLLFGLVFLLKPPLAGGALVCALHLARRERERAGRVTAAFWPIGVGALASLLPIALCALGFVVAGGWRELSWTFFEFVPGYTELGWHGSGIAAFYHGLRQSFTKFSALLAAGTLAVLLIRPIHSREREGMALLFGVIVMQLVGVAMQAKFFQYHYGATLPLIALLAGLGIYKVWLRVRVLGAPVTLSYALVLALLATAATPVSDLPGSFWQRSAERLAYALGVGPIETAAELDRRLYRVADFNLDTDRRVAEYIAEHTPAKAGLFVWGFEPAIYWLSERSPATRFIYNVPQRVSWGRDRARQELMADLNHRPPRVIVVQKHDYFQYVTGNSLDSLGALGAFPELARLVQQRYEFAISIEDFDLYVRRESG